MGSRPARGRRAIGPFLPDLPDQTYPTAPPGDGVAGDERFERIVPGMSR